MAWGGLNKRLLGKTSKEIIGILDREITCYSRELFTKVSIALGPQVERGMYNTALKLLDKKLDSVKPPTLVREGQLPSRFRDYNHVFYFKSGADKRKVRGLATKKMIAFDKHFKNCQVLGDFLENEVIRVINQEIKPELCIHELENIDGYVLKERREKKQHIDVFVLYRGKRIGIELKNSPFPFTHWAEVYDHATNCQVLGQRKPIKPFIFSKTIDGTTLKICNDRKVTFFPLDRLYYPKELKEVAVEFKTAFNFDFVEIGSRHLTKKIREFFQTYF